MTSSGTAVVTLPSDGQIVIVRVIAAPAGDVYEAFTTPALVRRWWHAGRGDMTACEIDLRVGGRWRYAMDARGGEVAFHGTFRELVPGHRIVFTELFEGALADEVVVTVTFDERDGGTTLTELIEVPSRVQRDAMVGQGMEDGAQVALDLLEQVAIGLPPAVRVGGVDFVSLPTRDLTVAMDFYGRVLGLPRSSLWQRPGHEPVGAEFETGTVTVALMVTERLGMEFQPHLVPIALHVDDVAAARAALEARGVVFRGDTIDSGVCHQALFHDPDGNLLDLHHRYAPRH
jgi:uncharacterized protein YndB with AHSA1/START domain/predicted enzyme related to lactoylglutathione lyase